MKKLQLVLLGFFFTGIKLTSMDLEVFLKLAEENYPAFKAETAESLRIKEAYEIEKGKNEALISISPSLTLLGPTSSAEYSAETFNKFSTDFNIKKPVSATGGVLSFQGGTVFTQKISGTETVNYKNFFSAAYVQPLLKNLGGAVSSASLDSALFDKHSAELKSEENREVLLLDFVFKYLDWVFLYETEKIYGERLKLAEDQLLRIRERYTAKLVDRIDVLRAEDTLNNAINNRLAAAMRLKSRITELSVLLGKDLSDINPVFSLYAAGEKSSVLKTEPVDTQDLRVFRLASLALDKLKRQRQALLSAAKPQLDMTVQAGLNRKEQTFTEAFPPEDRDIYVSIIFSLPAGNKSAEASVRQNFYTEEKLKADSAQAALAYESLIKTIQNQLENYLKILEINKKQLESGEARTAEENRAYEQGRGQLTNVLLSRDAEEAAKLRYLENALACCRLCFQYSALMDKLDSAVSEGAWK
jgi:outer membrane protein TolC